MRGLFIRRMLHILNIKDFLVLLLMLTQEIGSSRTTRASINRTEQTPKWRIVGGSPVEDTLTIPYIVSIQLCDDRWVEKKCPVINQYHYCGGSLISTSFVLTACHCLAGLSDTETGPAILLDEVIQSFTFLAGTSYIKDRGSHAQTRAAESIHVHPKCATVQGTALYDLGLAKMKTPFVVTKYVKPVKYYDDELLAHKLDSLIAEGTGRDNCVVAGWGDTRRGQNDDVLNSDVLNVLTMYVTDEDVCLSMYSERDEEHYSHFSFHDSKQICAVSREGTESDCVGDSGSPFVCDNFLIAVVSYGYECGSDLPSVYQTTASLNEWLAHHLLDGTSSNETMRKGDENEGWRVSGCLLPVLGMAFFAQRS